MLLLHNFSSAKSVCMSAASSSSSLPISFNNHFNQRRQCPSNLGFTQFWLITKPHLRSLHKSHICFTFSHSNNSDYEREESRWLREEQRWIREEQRWLRQEEIWNFERENLVAEISALKLRIQELEHQNSAQGGLGADTVANLSSLLKVLKAEGELGKKVNQIAETGSTASPFVVETTAEIEEEEVVVKAEIADEEVVVKEVVEASVEQNSSEGIKVAKKRKTLKMGAEGEEVRVLQEALQKLGYYSGEEDVEYSSFSTGTERAVKTWQASLGIPETGIMTAELLQRLYAEPTHGDLTSSQTGVNGAAFVLGSEISETKERIVREEKEENVDEFEHKVFLLGENRWENPSRLKNKKKSADGINTIKCLTCRGEGRLLCEECDGTGEPNVEEQFMEWIDEGMKCPYCEGRGYTLCDLCEGKTRKACQWIVEMEFHPCKDGIFRYVMSKIPH